MLRREKGPNGPFFFTLNFNNYRITVTSLLQLKMTMKKYIIGIACSMALTTIVAQKYNFNPMWKVGDVRKIVQEQTQSEYADDSLTETQSVTTYSIIKVVKENKDAYIVEFNSKNSFITVVERDMEGFGEALKDYSFIPFKFSINKKNGESELLNNDEVQQYLEEFSEKAKDELTKSDDPTGAFMMLAFLPIRASYKDKETIEASFEHDFGFITLPFKHELELGKTTVVIDTIDNPLNKSKQVQTTSTLKLESVDGSIAQISVNVDLDMEQFFGELKEMMKKMMRAFASEDESMEEQIKAVDEMEFSLTNKMNLKYNQTTGWVKEVDGKSVISVFDFKSKVNKKTETITKIRFE